MAPSPDLWPLLVVTNGPLRGRAYSIPPGRSTLGRDPQADLVVPSGAVSGRHAELERSGDRVLIQDLHSTNGTWLNRAHLATPAQLTPGDAIQVGDVELSFMPAAAAPAGPPAPATGYAFGDVNGPVQTGSGTQNVAGRDQSIYHGPVYDDHSYNVQNDYDAWDEVFSGKGPGRVVMAIGGIVALFGFALWAYFIMSSGSDVGSGDPFDSSSGSDFLTPLAIVGFCCFLGGGIVAGIGGSMSKAARKRAEQAQRRRQ